MESIVDTLKLRDAVHNTEAADLLQRAGFKRAALMTKSQYPVITQDAIQAYLKKIAIEFAEKQGRCKKLAEHGWGSWRGYEVHANRRLGIWDHYVAKWHESDLSDYAGIPPDHVLKRVIEARKVFKEIRVVTVTCEKKLPDPLVVGFNDEDHERYLIDYWDKDIDPTELVK